MMPLNNPRSLVFWMAYPGPGNLDGASRSLIDPAYLLASLDAVLADNRFRAIELTSLKSKKLREQVAARLRDCGKHIAFHCQPVQWVNEENLIDPADLCCPNEVYRKRAVDRILRLLDEARQYGAEQVFVASGRNPASGQPYDSGSDRVQRQALAALAQSLRTLAREALGRNQRLAVAVCDAGSPDPGLWRGQLLGPTSRVLEVLEPLRGEGLANLGAALDTGRLALNGESAQAVANLAPYLHWFHVGNCVGGAGDGQVAQRRGDTHPRFGVPDSQVTAPLIAEHLRALVETGYAGPIGIVVRPVGSEVASQVIDVAYSIVEEAAGSVDVAYALPLGFSFRSRDFLTEETFAELTELRVQQPDLIRDELAKRRRRETLAPDGRLCILAADHPARAVTRSGSHPAAMGHRLDYLGRIARVLAASNIDGLMATSDIIDEIVLLNYLAKQRGRDSFLDGKVLIGSMNRTGLAGAEHEMMDRTSSYMTGKRIKEMHLDGAKLLWRWVPSGEKNDRYALETLERVAKAVEECADLNLPVFVEPLPVTPPGTGEPGALAPGGGEPGALAPGGGEPGALAPGARAGYKTDHSTDNIIKAVGVASALGHFTGRVWLKIPYCADFARVAKATTMPVLLLGGESTGRPSGTIEDFVRGMGAGPNIRGALVGRNVLFCGDDDPAAIAEAIHLVVHERATAIDAIRRSRSIRGGRMDIFG
jgi:DhnA family fructose-bisphosphate aldolase class Ia/sugar phosphate isomerase/epimerase